MSYSDQGFRSAQLWLTLIIKGTQEAEGRWARPGRLRSSPLIQQPFPRLASRTLSSTKNQGTMRILTLRILFHAQLQTVNESENEREYELEPTQTSGSHRAWASQLQTSNTPLSPISAELVYWTLKFELALWQILYGSLARTNDTPTRPSSTHLPLSAQPVRCISSNGMLLFKSLLSTTRELN
jgi:hypothetical protein